VNGALAVPFQLPPGQQKTVTFVLTWHFPNVQRFQHFGNLYSRRWLDALGVGRYVAQYAQALWDRTRLYHQTVYQSNLPEEFLDAMTSQSVILRGPTCFWSEDGYFGGFEGSYGCCPLNCTHVWNYAQSHARLFPEVGQNMRISDFVTYLHESGQTSHRQHSKHNAFVDGHCACIEAAYREYQLSADASFLEKIWPGVKKAVDWLIESSDKDRDGIPAGHQWNTYDTAVSGANTFIGSQYLSALAAGEQLARVMKDEDSRQRWQAVREAGMKKQNETLWNGEYYIQIPEPSPARDYNNGCHADQLLGQWWAHMLNLGYLYPRDRVRQALEAVMKHNFRENFVGFKQDPRRYVLDDEPGLLICTWPHDDRPKSFILYADEVWTGIEYAAAGALVYEGLIDHARRIVKAARSRYDGHRRDTLNSGPGGNPYNELECGKFYARALSAWSLLIASQGLIQEGPRGVLGFKPKWQPADHRSLFTAPEGWGLFVQRQDGPRQTERIEVRHGRLRLKELVFELPPASGAATATVQIAGQAVKATLRRDGTEARLVLEAEVTITEGSTIDVIFQA
jgi:non-lysosomal glucosylceramidase